MAEIYLEVEDYLWFNEYQQGNVNVAGLVFDDLIEEIFDLADGEYIVYNDQLEETLDISEAFTPYHYGFCNDTLNITELFGGAPTRVRQSLLNLLYTTPINPVRIGHVHLDIVMSGTTTFREEVSDELILNSSYANAVPYYWETIFESFNIEMAEPQPLPPIYLRLYLRSTDLVNMRHDISQDYLFNSMCFEEFFLWDGILRGWDHMVADSLVNTDKIQEIIGKIADDYLFLEDTSEPRILVLHIISDKVFVFDSAEHERYFLLTAADAIDFNDVVSEFLGHLIHEFLILQEVQGSGVSRHCSAADSFNASDVSESERYYICLADDTVELVDGAVTFLSFDETALERFNTSATAVPVGTFVGLASESLTFRDIDSCIQGIIIQEGIAIGDVELTQWVFNVLVESGCDIADIIG